ncbi:hypothetical protein M0R45_001048 [Rubus argutus]|uniref:Transcription factor BREVIS RADIX N-terminal domain-containing protein n=1 Tax=Rubus argutus TaxID=59490 RepID=A0AAW1VJ08_RUBAR
MAAEESAKSKAAKEVIKSLTAQAATSGVYDTESIKQAYPSNGLEPNGIHYPDGEHHSRSSSIEQFLLNFLHGN